MAGTQWAALIAVAALAIWIAGALHTSELIPAFNGWLREPGNGLRLSLWAGAAAVALATLLAPEGWLLADLQSEAIGIAIAVIVIEEVQRRRAWQERKREIVEQMGSHSNDFALEAARIAFRHGWHSDGTLVNSRLEMANLSGAYLCKANLQHAWLRRARLQEANLSGANLQNAEFGSAQMHRANLKAANLQRAALVFADLRAANLEDASLEGANLFHTILQDATLVGANLQDARLQGADLQRAHLHGATVRGAVLRDAKLQGALYDDTTTWPDGFDPRQRGAVLSVRY